MNIKSYISVLCLTVVVEIIMANNIRLKRSPQQKYCGSQLADMLKILCKGKYNERKRSQMDLENSDYTQLKAYDTMDYPYQSEENAMTFIPSRLIRSPPATKITDECCYNPCSISELKTYCAQ